MALATLVLTVLLYIVIPKGLFPTQNTGQLQARVEAQESIAFPRMAQLQQEVARALLEDPEVASIASFVGVDAANNTMLHTGRLLINLTGSRGDQQALMERLRQRAHQVAGVTLYLQPVQDLTIDAESGPTAYRFALEGADTAKVNEWAARMVQQLQSVPQVRNPVTDAGASGAAIYVDIDRDTAARLNITAATIDEALYSAFGQRIVSTIFTQTNQYRVILEARPDAAPTPQVLSGIQLRTASGESTPLSAIARISERRAPLQITHVAQYPAATVGFDTAPGVSLGQAVDAVRQAARDAGLPAAVTMTFLGSAGAYQASLSNQLWLILAAVVCVYIVLGVLYESYVHPLTILSTLPSAGVGALLALMLTGQSLGVVGIIGIILLIGIVKKNAIMMIDFALDAQRTEGKPRAGGDPPGRAAAVPADPDDDAGGPGRRRAADAGLGRGRRAAPAARPGDLRRAGAQPAADAVHDAGDLPVVRAAGGAVARSASAPSDILPPPPGRVGVEAHGDSELPRRRQRPPNLSPEAGGVRR